MINEHFKNSLARFNSNPPANQVSIKSCLANLSYLLPDDYIRFLERANGGEGFVGKAYLILWRVEELIDKNAGYNVAEFAPGLLIFGSDGGGEAFAFDMRSTPAPVVSVPFIGMELAVAIVIAPSFDAFLETLSRS